MTLTKGMVRRIEMKKTAAKSLMEKADGEVLTTQRKLDHIRVNGLRALETGVCQEVPSEQGTARRPASANPIPVQRIA